MRDEAARENPKRDVRIRLLEKTVPLHKRVTNNESWKDRTNFNFL